MKRGMKTILVFIITFAIIIAVFWFVLPKLGIAGYFGSSYFVVAIIGSLVLSYAVSHLLNKLFFRRG